MTNLEKPIGYTAHTGLISLSIRPSVMNMKRHRFFM
jgi:hypothetical protein